MFFPLRHLPLELALEIIRLAAVPTVLPQTESPATIYASARSLAQVSYRVRQVTMPHLLHTVVFTSQDALHLFLRTLDQQRDFAAVKSRLWLDYTKYVRRIWTTRCWQPLVEQSADQYKDYGVLYPLFSKAQTIGLNVDAIHLLHEIIGGNRASTLPAWNCTRAVLAGYMRWNSIIGNAPGILFLAQLTHLTLWTFDASSGLPGSRISAQIYRTPLEYMPNLTYFAFSLIPDSPTAQPVIIYTTTQAGDRDSLAGGRLFREWISSDTPLNYGFIHELPIDSSLSSDVIWEFAFAGGHDTQIGTVVKI